MPPKKRKALEALSNIVNSEPPSKKQKMESKAESPIKLDHLGKPYFSYEDEHGEQRAYLVGEGEEERVLYRAKSSNSDDKLEIYTPITKENFRGLELLEKNKQALRDKVPEQRVAPIPDNLEDDEINKAYENIRVQFDKMPVHVSFFYLPFYEALNNAFTESTDINAVLVHVLEDTLDSNKTNFSDNEFLYAAELSDCLRKPSRLNTLTKPSNDPEDKNKKKIKFIEIYNFYVAWVKEILNIKGYQNSSEIHEAELDPLWSEEDVGTLSLPNHSFSGLQAEIFEYIENNIESPEEVLNLDFNKLESMHQELFPLPSTSTIFSDSMVVSAWLSLVENEHEVESANEKINVFLSTIRKTYAAWIKIKGSLEPLNSYMQVFDSINITHLNDLIPEILEEDMRDFIKLCVSSTRDDEEEDIEEALDLQGVLGFISNFDKKFRFDLASRYQVENKILNSPMIIHILEELPNKDRVFFASACVNKSALFYDDSDDDFYDEIEDLLSNNNIDDEVQQDRNEKDEADSTVKLYKNWKKYTTKISNESSSFLSEDENKLLNNIRFVEFSVFYSDPTLPQMAVISQYISSADILDTFVTRCSQLCKPDEVPSILRVLPFPQQSGFAFKCQQNEKITKFSTLLEILKKLSSDNDDRIDFAMTCKHLVTNERELRIILKELEEESHQAFSEACGIALHQDFYLRKLDLFLGTSNLQPPPEHPFSPTS